MGNLLSKVLLSNGPSDIQGNRDLFAPFVGSWDLEVVWYEGKNAVRRSRGEWHFAWVLNGRAIQDVWIVPPLAEQQSGAAPYEYGTSLRFPDADGKFWHSTWHGPVRNMVAVFQARRVGDEIVLDRQNQGDNRSRWVFYDIESDRFRWRNEETDGTTERWSIVQGFVANRMAS